jgi:hypothetical protein
MNANDKLNYMSYIFISYYCWYEYIKENNRNLKYHILIILLMGLLLIDHSFFSWTFYLEGIFFRNGNNNFENIEKRDDYDDPLINKNIIKSQRDLVHLVKFQQS